MDRGYDYRKYGLLYVDDEEISLKYFRKALEKEFTVLTASNVDEALAILNQYGDTIGVIISDQRMPGKTGVDLLTETRRRFPSIVRILATAYADIDSAIQAVNSGAIYRYINKPWEINDLRMSLLRAMEFFLVQRERDILFREKLHVLQRLVVTDRVRSLMVLAAGLSHHIRNSMTALKTFLDLAPDKLREEIKTSALHNPEFWEDFWSVAQRESQRIMRMVESVSSAVVEPSRVFREGLSPSVLLREAAAAQEPAPKSIVIDAPTDLPVLSGDPQMLRKLLHILIEKTISLAPAGATIRLAAAGNEALWQSPAVKFSVHADGPPWSPDVVASFFTAFVPSQKDPHDLGLNLLSAFFIAHHHNGDLAVVTEGPGGPGFDLLLPTHPDRVVRPTLEEDCLEKLFTKFEVWDSHAEVAAK